MDTEQLLELEYVKFIEHHESLGGYPTTREAFGVGFDFARKMFDRPQLPPIGKPSTK